MRSTRSVFVRVRAEARRGILVEAIGCLCAAAAIYVFVSYGLDRSLRLEVGFRLVLAIGCAFALWRLYVARLHRPIRFELADDEIALAVERQDPEIRQSLISAVQFERDLGAGQSRGAESAELKRRVVDDVEARVKDLRFHRALDRRRVRRFFLVGALAVGAVFGWAILEPAEAGLWAARNLAFSDEPWPRDTHMRFLDVDVGQPYRIAEREDLTLRVQVDGVVPDQVELDCAFASGELAVRPMTRTGERVFSVTLESLLEDAEVRAAGGDGWTQTLKITLIPRPRITDLELTLQYPEYMEREPSPVTDTGGDVRVPRGGRVTVAARSSKPLRRASLTFAQDDVVAVEISTDGFSMTGSYEPRDSGVLRIEALDHDDLGPGQPPQIYLRLVEDNPPDLDFSTDGIGSMITPIARIPGLLKLRDDYGVRTVAASYRVTDARLPENGEPKPDEREFEPAPVTGLDVFDAGSVESELRTDLDLQPLSPDADPESEQNFLQPGDTLSLRFTATDNFAPEPHVAQTETLNLRVVTRDKLIQELRRRQLEQRRELERVLEREVAARDELAEIVSPRSDELRAVQARLRLQALARQQNALGTQVSGIATRYRQILREMVHNRLYEPQIPRDLDRQIVSPLFALALDDFPESAARTAAFAESGDEDVRDSTVEAYDRIVAVIRSVLTIMERTEDIAAIIETVKIILNMEGKVEGLVEKALEAEGAGIFDRDRGEADKTDETGKPDKDGKPDPNKNK